MNKDLDKLKTEIYKSCGISKDLLESKSTNYMSVKASQTFMKVWIMYMKEVKRGTK